MSVACTRYLEETSEMTLYTTGSLLNEVPTTEFQYKDLVLDFQSRHHRKTVYVVYSVKCSS
jgi:hypothetical protein